MFATAARLVAAISIVAALAGCSLNEAPDVGGGAQSSASERSRQDARVVANVMRADLEALSGYGSACETTITVSETCTKAVTATRGATALALADIQLLRVPASMKSDIQTLTTALHRTEAACGPVLGGGGDRIAQAYASNEFDTAVSHVLAALSKVEGDSQ